MNAPCDPKQILAQSPMNAFQVMAVGICLCLNALDGFDILAISFASPGIASEWSINNTSLGVVLAMELFGMAIGSITLGGLADKIGRRPTILLCLTIMTAGMFCASLVTSVNQLLLIRLFTGLGIGGMLASTNAMTAEYSNAKYRNLAVILMSAGYPIGIIIGGSISTQLLVMYDWRAIFVFGSAVTGFFLFIVWFLLPESIEYLAGRRPANYLERINKTLSKMGHERVSQLAENTDEVNKASFLTLFSSKLRAVTLLMMASYFSLVMTYYYILKWIPKIIVDMGFDASSAGTVLVWANVGGLSGALIFGLIATRYSLRTLLVADLIIAFCMVSAFGMGHETLKELSIIAAITVFFTNASIVGFFALMAKTFPAELRAGGTGVVIGTGRGGAALGPVVAGFLFTAGFGLQTVSILMASGALVAALCIACLGPVLSRYHSS
jgi:benzoate transport